MLPDHPLPRHGARPRSGDARPAVARLAHLTLAAALALLAGCAATPEPAPAEPVPAVPAAVPEPSPAPAEEPDKPEADAAGMPSTDGSAPAAAAEPTRPAASLPRQMLLYADRVRSLPPPELMAEIARLSDAQAGAGSPPDQSFQLALALLQTRQPADTARSLGLVQKLLADNRPAATSLQPLARLLENRLLQQRRLEDQLDRQAQQLKEGQRRIDQLNERLEAMRAIERSLNARPGAPGNGRAAPPAPTESPR
ncbi:hypothetical protein QRO11_19490 [Paracidovorax citrulli]|uniref:hypothetical protein n=1 Tax=Paracidovorax citrulli TaxID=80869 RepID=UPI0008915691|nr:hypothetical protein [Paracidovorax citrulli]UMT87053.1 hypothetical protein FRC90_02595 [Paracidovorax citrulli]WIY34100.1 hypothetical protein QRO11_19490 [Paracidovorax citrulli]SDJ20014.1 hypothetical protein SAMN04489709_102125 [Paracidovorax citrulli]